MQGQPSGPSFRPGFLQTTVQKHNLNQLLQIHSRQSNGNNINPSAVKQQRMRFMLQQQQSTQLRPHIQASHSVIRSNGPPTFPQRLQQVNQPRQYVFVSHPTSKPQPHSGSSQVIRSTAVTPAERSMPGQIQLGQTYQFDVKRSPQLSQPGSIILKKSPNVIGNQAQRIPLGADDKGKFIPFSQLLVPRLKSLGGSAKTVNIPPNNSQRLPVPTLSKQPTNSAPMFMHPQFNIVLPPNPSGLNQPKMLEKCSPVTPIATEMSDFKPVVPKLKQSIMEVDNPPQTSINNERDQEPFDWDEYLKLTKSKPGPHTSFKHIEISLHNGFNSGMKLEVANKSDSATYWVATLISTCGRLLLLRYDGCGDDRKTDFWVDVCTADIHPIGWCAQNGKTLQPPESIRNLRENWAEFLVKNLIGARTAPERLLSGPFKGKTVVELIEPRMLLEVQDSQHPQHVWMADVLRNVGGRLLLRYKGLSDADAKFDFWLFYLDVRLHQVGWGKEHHLTMKPPDAIRNKYNSKEHWAYVLSMSLKGVTEQDLVPSCVFYDQVKLKQHDLKESLKLAVLDPINPTKIRPATVVKIVNKFFFLAELDDSGHQSTSCAFLCHSGSSGVFSIDWCKQHNIPITPPRGCDATRFDWDEYLRKTGSEGAPSTCFSYTSESHCFEKGMKLEACSPYNLYEICVATIVEVYGNVLHLRLSASLPGTKGQKSSSIKKFVDCFVHSSSQDIFPVGWCDSNNYPLSAPSTWRQQPFVTNALSIFPNKKVAIVQPEVQKPKEDSDATDQSLRSVINPSSSSKLWCPVVCFNCTCKSGMFLNDHALSKVPRFVGPGNTSLVLKEVLSLLVGAAERPHKLLKDLEDFTVGRGNQPCIIKAKFEGKKYQATLHIVDSAASVPGYFGALAQFLKCCPNLLTLKKPMTDCPLNCIRERKVGRPPSTKNFAAQRGRKKKFFINRMKNTGVSAMSKPPMKTGLRPFVKEIPGCRMLRHHRLSPGTGSYRHRRDVQRISSHIPSTSDELKRSVVSLATNNPADLRRVLRQRQERLKLHRLELQSNPLHWTVEEVVEFMQSTDCSQFSRIFSQQQIDGQALLLLTLPVVQEFMELKLGPALKVSRHIERVKMAFYENFAARKEVPALHIST